MAVYKQPCIHCGTLIERFAKYCQACGSSSPFGYVCPSCRTPIEKCQNVCSGCGKELYVLCPYCNQKTFVQDRCEQCAQSLMVTCTNKRCGEQQFFQNVKCTACGKKIKNKKL